MTLREFQEVIRTSTAKAVAHGVDLEDVGHELLNAGMAVAHMDNVSLDNLLDIVREAYSKVLEDVGPDPDNN